jgi:Carboxypeptidase regulatory-like domain
MKSHSNVHSAVKASCPQSIHVGSLLFCVILCCLPLITAHTAHAQNTATSGHVVDSVGKAIVGAQVDLTNAATHEVVKAQTNGDGYFQFPPVAPGIYTAHANASGFASYTLDRVILEVGTTRLLDMTLSPSAKVENVVVTATAPELVTDEPDRGNVIEEEFTQNIPLNIRNPLQMVNFAAGVTALSPDSGNNDSSELYTNTFQINGAKISTTESLLDGGANTTPYDLNAVAAVPQVDSIQEFKVISIAYAPEWGRTSGGVVTFATKPGTDQLHGSTYDYVRNSDTDANSFNADGTTPVTAKPHFQRNQFGFTLGGPAAFPPHFRDSKHKTFFFATYEGLRQSTASNAFYTVPSALERNGDFSQSLNSDGKQVILYDPSSSILQAAGSVNPPCTTNPVAANSVVYCRATYLSEYGANKIPGTLDSAGKAIIGSYPAPNTTGTNGSDVNDYYSNAPTSSDQNTVGARLDHRFNDKHSIFAHFDWFQRMNNFGDPYRNGLSPVANNQTLPGDNVMLDHTWVIAPSLVFDHHFVRAHQESNRIPPSLGFNPTSIGFNGNVVNGLQTTTFPYVSSATGVSAIGPTSGNERDGGTVYEYAAALSQLHGKHTFKYGVDYRFLALDLNINELVSLTATNHFTTGPNVQNVTEEPDAGSGIADLLLGTGQVTSGIVPGFRTTHPYWAFFAQDQYHVLPTLTLTYGLRYNIELPDEEAHNQFQYLNLTSPSPLNSQVTSLGTLTGGPGFVGVNGVGPRLQTTQYHNFDPRLGFADEIDNKTVVRGGYGIFHLPSNPVLSSSVSQGFSAVTTSTASINGALPLYNMDSPFPSGLVQPSGSSLGLATNAGFSITGYPRSEYIGYTQEWSLDLQRQLPLGFVLTLGYVGNRGMHLNAPLNYNQLPDSDLAQGSALNAQVANPFYGVIDNQASTLSHATVPAYQLLLPHPQFTTVNAYLLSNAASNYNALQLTLEHRFAQGLSVLFNYTHSKMMDDTGNGLDFVEGLGAYQDNYCPKCDWSVSEQDLRDVMRLAVEYQLPFGRGQEYLQHGPLAWVLGNWSLGGFFTYDDGLPQTITEATSTSSTANTPNIFGGGHIRPNVTGVSTAVPGGRKLVHNAKVTSEFFNPAAFVAAAPYSFGDASRYQSTIRVPGTVDLDTLAERAFPIHDRVALNFRLELFNTLNHVQLSGLDTTLGTANFGYLTPTQYNSPRSMQYSLRLAF